MSEGLARTLLLIACLWLVAAAAATDLGVASGARFWSDGATYYSMAWSLAEDGDLRYEAHDLERVRREFPSGPEGIFLKRSSGGLVLDAAAGFPWLRRLGPSERRVYYAKSFAYALAAAPLVRALGTRGLLVTNALCLCLALALAYWELRRRNGPASALGLSAAIYLCTVAPVYLFWPQPELFNLGLIAAALAAWRGGRPLLAAALLGVATYSKPTNLLLALPLGLGPLVGGGRVALVRGIRESARRGLVLLLCAGGLFALNAAVTGEPNYQGGERKTFYGHFPFESPSVTFGNSGFWMTTEHLGPTLPKPGEEARAEARGTVERPREELEDAVGRNLAYFWVGRYSGMVTYFPPVALAVALFLVVGPRDHDGWLALSTLGLSALAYVLLIPDNWYGGGGTLGNRYFLNLLPLAACFAPSRGRWLVVGGGVLGAAVLLGPVYAAPVAHSIQPGRNALRAPLRLFPLELTMLNDLGFCSDPWRKKQPFGDPEGDPRRGRRADPLSFWLYFPDDGTYGKEEVGGAEGFWLRRGQRSEVVLRALEPVQRLVVRLEGGPEGDIVRVRAGRAAASLALHPHGTGELRLDPGRDYRYYLSHVYVIGFESQGVELRSLAPPGDSRLLGAFVRLRLEIAGLPHAPPAIGGPAGSGREPVRLARGGAQ